MTWWNPRTWTYQEVVTPAQLNQQLRDNLQHLFDTRLTAEQGNAAYRWRLGELVLDVTHPDYGATGDGTTDDTAAIQAAFDAADAAVTAAPGGLGPTVYFPPGVYRVTSTLVPKAHGILGHSPQTTRIKWDGAATGTCMADAITYNGAIRSLRFDPGTNAPACWIDKTAGQSDWGGDVTDVFFGNIDATNGIAAIRFGQIINAYMRRVRFQHGRWAVEINQPDSGSFHRNFVMEDFTVDVGAASVAEGIVRCIMGGSNAQLSLRIANARIEGGANLSGVRAVVKVESNPANSLGVMPVFLSLSSISGQITGASGISLLYQETTQTAVQSQIVVASSRLDSFLSSIAGGTWSSFNYNAWPVPQGPVSLWAVGRYNPSATNTNSVQFGQSVYIDDVKLNRTAATTLTLTGKLATTGELEVDGALNHDGTAVGFYGTAPVARPSLTYSRTGETMAEAQLRAALAALGLVTDSTTA